MYFVALLLPILRNFPNSLTLDSTSLFEIYEGGISILICQIERNNPKDDWVLVARNTWDINLVVYNSSASKISCSNWIVT